MNFTSKTLIILGIIFIIAGLVWHFSGGNLPFGKLPGDVRIETKNAKFYFPLASSLFLSVILSLVFYFLRK